MGVGYKILKLSEIEIESNKMRKENLDIDMRFGGIKKKASQRTLNSFFGTYGIDGGFFRGSRSENGAMPLFSPAEIMNRVKERNPEDLLRVAYSKDSGTLLGVTPVEKKIVKHNEAMRLLEELGANDIKYHFGEVRGTFDLSHAAQEFNIGSDAFKYQFEASIPVDGAENPYISPGLLRLICLNGLVGMNSLFSSRISLRSDKPIISLRQAIENFDNDKAFSFIEEKMLEAQTASASVHDVLKLSKVLERNEESSLLVGDLHKKAGLHQYGNVSQVNANTKKGLPSNMSMYDLVNYATETATHVAGAGDKRRIDAAIGQILKDDFNLPGLHEKKEAEIGMFDVKRTFEERARASSFGEKMLGQKAA